MSLPTCSAIGLSNSRFRWHTLQIKASGLWQPLLAPAGDCLKTASTSDAEGCGPAATHHLQAPTEDSSEGGTAS